MVFIAPPLPMKHLLGERRRRRGSWGNNNNNQLTIPIPRSTRVFTRQWMNVNVVGMSKNRGCVVGIAGAVVRTRRSGHHLVIHSLLQMASHWFQWRMSKSRSCMSKATISVLDNDAAMRGEVTGKHILVCKSTVLVIIMTITSGCNKVRGENFNTMITAVVSLKSQ